MNIIGLNQIHQRKRQLPLRSPQRPVNPLDVAVEVGICAADFGDVSWTTFRLRAGRSDQFEELQLRKLRMPRLKLQQLNQQPKGQLQRQNLLRMPRTLSHQAMQREKLKQPMQRR
ncbi:unnamed protein product, partial [Cladocopium goreaui]